MLLTCPECELQISDKALSCPHCGYPLVSMGKSAKQTKTIKRKRLPNGFGQISKISNRDLRRPYRASVTVGKTNTGKPITKPLKPVSYFETYNDAYMALVEYNRNPFDIDENITMNELYKRWSERHFESLKTEASRNHFRISWRYCSAIYDLRVKDFRIRHMKDCMENGSIVVGGSVRKPTTGQKNRLKTLFNLMLDYAVEYDMVDKNYAREYKLPKEVVAQKNAADTPHISFTNDEINTLWDNLDKKYVDLVLIAIYSGWRIQEFGNLKLEDIDLENWTFTGGMKTEAGVERTVPIHPKIRELVKRKYDESKALECKRLVFFRMRTPLRDENSHIRNFMIDLMSCSKN